jgi:putative exosortase-associated protein (TIGR04073 family)
MKPLGAWALILPIIFMSSVSCAPAQEAPLAKDSPAQGRESSPAGLKAERGIKNILFGWTEIPKSVLQVTQEMKNPFLGVMGGMLKGISRAYPKTISGVVDVATFPITDYEKLRVKDDEIPIRLK